MNKLQRQHSQLSICVASKETVKHNLKMQQYNNIMGTIWYYCGLVDKKSMINYFQQHMIILLSFSGPPNF